jgi:TorA maturation chaperone TorD
MSEAPATATPVVEPEDQARADFYALLARLFSAPPDAALLAAISAAPALALVRSDGDADVDRTAVELGRAWDELRSASAAVDVDAAREEYETLFIGVGRSEVSLYASHYLGPQSGRPLAEIRAALSELGLARRATTSEFEDHLAVLLEAMRMLVAGDGDRRAADMVEQRTFFRRYVAVCAAKCCAAIEQTSVANYYVRVAQFARHFVQIEEAAFALA